MTSNIQLYQGDCLEVMKNIPDKSIDLVLTDPPYGTTACKWDSVIPLEPMWKELKRITKPNSAIVLFGTEPFSSYLRMSNIGMFKYDWMWAKNDATDAMNAKNKPMRKIEKFMCSLAVLQQIVATIEWYTTHKGLQSVLRNALALTMGLQAVVSKHQDPRMGLMSRNSLATLVIYFTSVKTKKNYIQHKNQ